MTGDNTSITPHIADLHIKRGHTRHWLDHTIVFTFYNLHSILRTLAYNIRILRCMSKKYHFLSFLSANWTVKVWDLFEGVQPPLATITIQQQKCHKITKYHLAADFVGGSKMYQLARLGCWRGAGLVRCWWQLQILNFWVNLQNSNCIAIV